MGLFGIGVYEPVSYAPPGSIFGQDIIAANAGGVPGVNTMLYTTAVKKDHPKAYLMLAELTGTKATDSSGNANTGTINGSVGYNIQGPLSGPGESSIGGMQFNGAAYVSLPSSLNPSAFSALTLEVMVNAPGSYTGNPRLIANSHTDIDNKGVQLLINGTNGTVTFNLGRGTSHQGITSLSPLEAGDWTYLAATWDGQMMTLYYNGAPQVQAPFTGPIASVANPLNLGRNPAYNGDFYIGGMAQCAIYNRCLSADTIALRNQYANAIGSTLYGGGFPTVPFQPLAPYSAVYGGQYGYILYTNIRAPKVTQWIPAPSIGNDNLGNPTIRGFPQMTWTYSTLRPDYWYFLKYLYRLAGNAPPEYQYLVMIQYPDQSGQNTPVQQLARWDPPTHSYRTVGAYYGAQLKFTYIGQAQLAASVPLVTVI